MRCWYALLLVGCGGSSSPSSPVATTAKDSPPPPTSASTCTAKAEAGVAQKSIDVSGKKRSYTVVAPNGTNLPLVFVLHGHGGSGAQARKAFGLEQLAKDKAIFIYPDGIGGGWDLDSPATKNNDVQFFDSMLALTNISHCPDLKRVFVTGFSNGGYMANQLACRRADRIRAVASHSSGGPYESQGGEYDERGQLKCNGKPVPSLVIHGQSDGTVAPSEGQKSIDHFAHWNSCSSSTTNKEPCGTLSGCSNMVCKIPKLGHQLWPDAGQTIWTFFDGQR